MKIYIGFTNNKNEKVNFIFTGLGLGLTVC